MLLISLLKFIVRSPGTQYYKELSEELLSEELILQIAKTISSKYLGLFENFDRTFHEFSFFGFINILYSR